MLHFWIGYVNLSGPMFGQGQSWTRGGEALAKHLVQMSKFLRTVVRGNFNIHGTKNFQDAVFHQKSKI